MWSYREQEKAGKSKSERRTNTMVYHNAALIPKHCKQPISRNMSRKNRTNCCDVAGIGENLLVCAVMGVDHA